MQSISLSVLNGAGDIPTPHTVWATPAGTPCLPSTAWPARLLRRLWRRWTRTRRTWAQTRNNQLL